MNHKVLLADDSLTIQKVIKITLANQPYDIFDCSSEGELFKKLPEVKPDLVFLDFNLSENFSGFELTSKIKAIAPNSQVLLLLGTFDSVDDASMEKCGAADKIVKPFDSNKFIAICKRLLDNKPQAKEIDFPVAKEVKPQVFKEEDQWSVNHTVEHKITSTPENTFDVRHHLNPLDQEVSDWGMSVPGIINSSTGSDLNLELPPVIGEVMSLESHRNKSLENSAGMGQREETRYPASDDLDYPTIEELQQTTSKIENSKESSNLISLESFSQDTFEFEIEHTINNQEESDISALEAQIQDEVEEDLWKVDEFQDLKNEVAAKIEAVKNNFKPSEKDFDESLFRPLDENESLSTNLPSETDLEYPSIEENKKEVLVAPDLSSLRNEIEALVKKHVKEYMDQMFKQGIEKVTWEVVPDLAENLIRQELSKISNKILNDS